MTLQGLTLFLFLPLLLHLLHIAGWSRRFKGALHPAETKARNQAPGAATPWQPERAEDLTVVLPARNEARALPRLLADLAKGNCLPAAVIVVDDASDDDTLKAIAPSGGWPFPLNIMANPGTGKKAGLSAGMRAAETTWVVQVDADVRIGRHFIDAIAQTLAQSGSKFDMLLLPLRLANAASGSPQRTLDVLQALDFAAMQGWAVAAVQRSRPAMASGGAWVWRRSAFPHDALRPELASGDDVFSLAALIAQGDGNRVGWVGRTEAMASAAPMPTLRQLLDQRIRWGAKSTAYPRALKEARRVATTIAAMHAAGIALLILHPLAGLAFWATKALGDMAYTHQVGQAYGLFDGMGALRRVSALALLALVHPPFIITTLLLMPFRKVRWKGRTTA